MKAHLDHANLSVKNLNESIKWYKKYFGFEVVESDYSPRGNYAILKNGESMLCMRERPSLNHIDESGHSGSYLRINHIGLSIEDKALWERFFKEESFTTTYPSPQTYPHSTSWYVADPSGHEVEVVAWNNGKANFKDLPNKFK